MKTRSDDKHSRRAIMRGAAKTLAGGAALAAGLGERMASAQAAKAPQSAAQYQATPKGNARCQTCVAFLAPSACKVVAGTVSPNGWCVMYAPKS